MGKAGFYQRRSHPTKMPIARYLCVVTPLLLGMLYLANQIFDPIPSKVAQPSYVPSRTTATAAIPAVQILTVRDAPAPPLEVLTSSEMPEPTTPVRDPTSRAQEANAAAIASHIKKPKRLLPVNRRSDYGPVPASSYDPAATH